MIHLLWLSLAIPVVIHLVHRRKARRVMFSTLRFLRMVDQRVARRQRLKELLLLAVRLLLLAAVIAALYRPMVRSATFKGGNVPAAVAVVLDNTYSMRTAARGALRFDQAKKAAAGVLDALQKGDAACLLVSDSPEGARPEMTTGLGRLREELNAVECGYGTAELAPVLRRAVQCLQENANPRKELYVITDFQRLCWTPALADVGKALPPDAPVYLVDVGGETASNLSLESAEFGLNVQVVGASADLYCSVRNRGSRNSRTEASLFLDGEKVAGQELALASAGQIEAAFSHTFDRTGEHVGQVSLGPDELDADNARCFTLTVQDKLPVLLVNGAPSAVPYLDETFYLELALKAPPAGGQTLSPIEPRTVTADDFLKQRLEDYACVILANVPRLDGLWEERLRRYVAGGGGLIIFLGDRVDPVSYDSVLASPQDPLLPVSLGELQQAAAEGEAAFHIIHIGEQHPVFRGLAGQMDLKTARVTRFFSLAVPEGKGVDVLAELDRGPLLLERKAGPGTVMLCTSTADLDWNNLAARPFFLPMLHQMVYEAGRPGARAESVAVGMPYVLELPQSEQPVDVAFYGPRENGGDGAEAPLAVLRAEPVGGGQRVLFSLTRRPGIYRATYTIGGVENTRRFAVNVDPRESDSDRIEPEEAGKLLGAASVRVIADAEHAGALAHRERTGLPLWNYAFALALALAVVESYVGNVVLKH
jgi:hypothetical protein